MTAIHEVVVETDSLDTLEELIRVARENPCSRFAINSKKAEPAAITPTEPTKPAPQPKKPVKKPGPKKGKKKLLTKVSKPKISSSSEEKPPTKKEKPEKWNQQKKYNTKYTIKRMMAEGVKLEGIIERLKRTPEKLVRECWNELNEFEEEPKESKPVSAATYSQALGMPLQNWCKARKAEGWDEEKMFNTLSGLGGIYGVIPRKQVAEDLSDMLGMLE